MTTLLLATHNAHKVAEIRAILDGQFQFLTLNDFPDAPVVVEDAGTFGGNAIKKATELTDWLATDNANSKIKNLKMDFVLADDSGLEVDALNGAPGVHSARFAALDKDENSPDHDNNTKLLRLLKDVPLEKRTARFRCVIALVSVLRKTGTSAWPVGYAEEREVQLFNGSCNGKIIFAARGQNGFGYDPLFMPDGCRQTFAELGDEVKNRLSHRAHALEKLKEFLKTSSKECSKRSIS